MNEIRIFENSAFGELEVREIEGKVYFPATTCARMLGYTNPHKAIKDHCAHLTKREGVCRTVNQHGVESFQIVKINYIPEGDLYRLIVHSRLPAAEEFERWVFDEVLPSIRQTGGYGADTAEVLRRIAEEAIRGMVPALIKSVMDALPKMLPTAPETRKSEGRRVHTIIGSLEDGLRQTAEDLIMDGRYTYCEISNILWERYGIRVGKSSVHRYSRYLRDNPDFRTRR